MAEIKKEFNEYVIDFYTKGGAGMDALINLYFDTGKVGVIAFYKEGMTPPPNANDINGLVVFYPIADFNNILTLLRYEKPLYLSLNADYSSGRISTGAESVGDHDRFLR